MTSKTRPYKPKKKSAPKPDIEKLTDSFDISFKNIMPIVPLPDGSVTYKDYIIKEGKGKLWYIYTKRTGPDSHGEFNLKSCAIVAAKALSKMQLERFNEIKMMDSKYWSHYSTTLVCQHNLNKTKDYEHYLIMLNKLEHSKHMADLYKEQISRLFRWSFV